MEKIIYFVRHGETEGNLRDAVQDGTDPLSAEGRLQAERVAERARKIEFDTLISSDYLRARETALAISRAVGREHRESVHFREVRHPSAFVGIARSTEDFKVYTAQQFEHMGDETWHYADEENFFELRSRAVRAEEELLTHSTSRILVVTHANFLKCLIGHLIFQHTFTPELFIQLRLSLSPSNTGLSIMRYKNDRWHLVTWNDHSHLG